MDINEASWDRIARLVLAALLGVASVGAGGAVGILLGVLAGVMLVTGVTGRCPLYRLAGFSTCPVRPQGGPEA